ncbi:hypothetical protein D3C76_1548740 [compost metagenome]
MGATLRASRWPAGLLIFSLNNLRQKNKTPEPKGFGGIRGDNIFLKLFGVWVLTLTCSEFFAVLDVTGTSSLLSIRNVCDLHHIGIIARKKVKKNHKKDRVVITYSATNTYLTVQ